MDRKVPSLTLIQHKSKATPAKAHNEIGERENRSQPGMTLLKQCIVLKCGSTFEGFCTVHLSSVIHVSVKGGVMLSFPKFISILVFLGFFYEDQCSI